MKEGKFINALAFSRLAVFLAIVLLIAEIGMTVAGHPNGLSEAVTTPLFGICTGLLGYAGACIQMRQQKQDGGDNVPTLTDRNTGTTE